MCRVNQDYTVTKLTRNENPMYCGFFGLAAFDFFKADEKIIPHNHFNGGRNIK